MDIIFLAVCVYFSVPLSFCPSGKAVGRVPVCGLHMPVLLLTDAMEAFSAVKSILKYACSCYEERLLLCDHVVQSPPRPVAMAPSVGQALVLQQHSLESHWLHGKRKQFMIQDPHTYPRHLTYARTRTQLLMQQKKKKKRGLIVLLFVREVFQIQR